SKAANIFSRDCNGPLPHRKSPSPSAVTAGDPAASIMERWAFFIRAVLFCAGLSCNNRTFLAVQGILGVVEICDNRALSASGANEIHRRLNLGELGGLGELILRNVLLGLLRGD